jgi:DNA-binding MarR family transcriptional regulator
MPSKNENANRLARKMGAECLAMRSRLIGRAVSGLYDDVLRPLGVTSAQLSVLAVIAAQGPISPGEVGNTLQIEKSTMSRNVSRLKKNGWVEVSAGETGRSRFLEINESGRQLLLDAEPSWIEAQQRADKLLGADGPGAIQRLARSVRASPE